MDDRLGTRPDRAVARSRPSLIRRFAVANPSSAWNHGRVSWSVVVAFLACLVVPWPSIADDRGWDYLTDKLIDDGVEREQVLRVFRDSRMPWFTGLDFSPRRPREPRSMYRRFLRGSTAVAARRCRTQHAADFEAAERASRVPGSVLAAILFVETGCGRNTGSSMILYRLARLAMANEPENLRRNLARYAAGDDVPDFATATQLRMRARYLEDTFYPEVRALFTVARQMGVSPLELRGSPSGAFGYPQFLPTSYLRYGTDGDGDGEVSLYNTADAAASAARYLTGFGWRSGLTRAQQRAVIWQYNHSDAYIDTVLTLAARIDGAPVGAPQMVRRHKRLGKETYHARRAGKPQQLASSKPLPKRRPAARPHSGCRSRRCR
jgi:membrane-bound lytic murein transglycosylase B